MQLFSLWIGLILYAHVVVLVESQTNSTSSSLIPSPITSALSSTLVTTLSTSPTPLPPASSSTTSLSFFTRPAQTTATSPTTSNTPDATQSSTDDNVSSGLSGPAKRALIITGSVVGSIIVIALAVLFYHKCIKGEDTNGEVHSGYTVPRPIKSSTAMKPFEDNAIEVSEAQRSNSTLYMQGTTASMNNPYVYVPANSAAYYVAAPQNYYVDGYPVQYATTTAPFVTQHVATTNGGDSYYQQQPYYQS